MITGQPMFPSTVVSADASNRLLISARENRKIGHMVTKGPWRGFPIFTLTLAERASCPAHCHMFDSCYGNAMPFARRHKHGLELEQKLEKEVAALAKEHVKGFVVRLHVLGDFYSRRYVGLWREMLAKHKALHVYGYTAHRIDAPDAEDRTIAEAIDNAKREFPSRFAVRWSRPESGPGHAIVIDYVPSNERVPEGIVCPAEREKSACCATCGLCWSAEFMDETIVFMKHGFGSSKNTVIANKASAVETDGWRPIRPIDNLTSLKRGEIGDAPAITWVDPKTLHVDETYQRSLNKSSIRLISSIVTGWNWAHFKPPVVGQCEKTGRFFVVDGQHTAIAAATHGSIEKIPVIVATVPTIRQRARAFLSHNKNRINVTATQQYYASIVCGDPEAIEINEMCKAACITILKHPPNMAAFKIGETLALRALQFLLRRYGRSKGKTVLKILAKRAPVRADDIKAVAKLLYDPSYENALTPQMIVEALNRIDDAHLGGEARRVAADTALPLWEARSIVIYQATRSS
jgi:hypothetical protein